MYNQAPKVQAVIQAAHKVVIVQADNPDADSLGSALAMEQILGDLGKQPSLYCAVDMPSYLRHLRGWDRVQKELPKQFDASVIVDASTMTLLEGLQTTGQQSHLASKPCIVLDHHEVVEKPVPFATITINDGTRASAGELIYLLAQQLQWPLSLTAQEYIMSSILGDTQGLTNELASPVTYRLMADMIEAGVDRPALEELRREFNKMPRDILRYKAALINRAEFISDGQIAHVTIPQNEINQYSPLYNPAPLIQGDLLQTSGVALAIVFKTYSDGRVTGAIRANHGFPIAAETAKKMGGGGHAYASGFKDVSGRPYNEIKSECVQAATELLAKLHKENSDEIVQYAYSTD